MLKNLIVFFGFSLNLHSFANALNEQHRVALENIVKLNQHKPTKVELEIALDRFPTYRIREVWWFQNSQSFKVQTYLVNSDWLYWEILYRGEIKLGPLQTQAETIKPFSVLSEQIFFISTIFSLLQALGASNMSNLESTLSRQQGRVSIKFTNSLKPSNAVLWLDQTTGELSRILSPTGCDSTLSLSGQVSQYPKTKKLKWLNDTAHVETKFKSEITKYEANFFEKLSNKYSDQAPDAEAKNFVEHLKQFYQICR